MEENDENLKSIFPDIISQIPSKNVANEYNDFLILGLEHDVKGLPSAFVCHLKASPYTAIGLLDVAIQSLTEEKDKIYARINLTKAIPKLIDSFKEILNEEQKTDIYHFMMELIALNPDLTTDELFNKTLSKFKDVLTGKNNSSKNNNSNPKNDSNDNFKYDI